MNVEMNNAQIHALMQLAGWWEALERQYVKMAGEHPSDYPPLTMRRVLFYGTRGVDYTEVTAAQMTELRNLARRIELESKASP